MLSTSKINFPMKKIFTFLFTLIWFSSIAQYESQQHLYDSTAKAMKNFWSKNRGGVVIVEGNTTIYRSPRTAILLTDTTPLGRLQTMQAYHSECFRACQKEFITGAIISLAGLGISAVSLALDPIKLGISLGGSALSLIGGIVMIDSHKWIGRAGRVHFTGNAVVFDF
jgi:hypothetical protein